MTAPDPDVAAHDQPDGHGPPSSEDALGGRVSWRPSRRPLLLMLPSAVVGTAMLVLPLLSGPFLIVLGFAVVFLWRYVLSMLLGWTTVDDQGITNRGVLRPRHTSWGDVESLSVVTTLFGRFVMVGVKGSSQKVPLSAPREGLLARTAEGEDLFARLVVLAEPHELSLTPGVSRRAVWVTLAAVLLFVGALSVPLEEPWKRSWWPWLHEVSEISEPCALNEAEVLVGGPLQEDASESSSDRTWTCEWNPPEAWTSLRVTYELNEYRYNSSGTDTARGDYARTQDRWADEDYRTVSADAPVGLGEEAMWAIEHPTGDATKSRVSFLVREANVVVEVAYAAEDPAEEVQADAEAIAREALDRVEVD
jgi:hypothetical protein